MNEQDGLEPRQDIIGVKWRRRIKVSWVISEGEPVRRPCFTIRQSLVKRIGSEARADDFEVMYLRGGRMLEVKSARVWIFWREFVGWHFMAAVEEEERAGGVEGGEERSNLGGKHFEYSGSRT